MKIVKSTGKGTRLFWLALAVVLALSFKLKAQTPVADSLRKEIAALDKKDPDFLDHKAGAIGTLLQHLKYSHPAQSLLLCDTLYDAFMQVRDTVGLRS